MLTKNNVQYTPVTLRSSMTFTYIKHAPLLLNLKKHKEIVLILPHILLLEKMIIKQICVLKTVIDTNGELVLVPMYLPNTNYTIA